MDSPLEWEHDGDLDFMLDYLIECAESWEPKARLLGNARAEDIAAAIRRVKRKVAWYDRRCNEMQAAQSRMRDPERKWVCDILANGFTEYPVTHP